MVVQWSPKPLVVVRIYPHLHKYNIMNKQIIISIQPGYSLIIWSDNQYFKIREKSSINEVWLKLLSYCRGKVPTINDLGTIEYSIIIPESLLIRLKSFKDT